MSANGYQNMCMGNPYMPIEFFLNIISLCFFAVWIVPRPHLARWRINAPNEEGVDVIIVDSVITAPKPDFLSVSVVSISSVSVSLEKPPTFCSALFFIAPKPGATYVAFILLQEYRQPEYTI